jgi:hypothetical protein
MAVFYLRNSKSPEGKIVPVTISLSLDSVKAYKLPTESGELPTLYDPEGDQQWLLIVSTSEPDVNGNDIDPEIVNVVTTGTVYQEITAAMNRLGQQVDWGDLSPDIQAPKLVAFEPSLENTTEVPITSDIVARLQDSMPAAGIDFSTVTFKINDFDVTDDVEMQGSPFDLTLIYRPTRIL